MLQDYPSYDNILYSADEQTAYVLWYDENTQRCFDKTDSGWELAPHSNYIGTCYDTYQEAYTIKIPELDSWSDARLATYSYVDSSKSRVIQFVEQTYSVIINGVSYRVDRVDVEYYFYLDIDALPAGSEIATPLVKYYSYPFFKKEYESYKGWR